MTLVTNIISKDFSIMTADKRALTEGPTTIQAGGLTINSKKGVSITGYDKIVRSVNNRIILGIAGSTNEHTYLREIKNTTDIKKVVSKIKDFVNNNIDIMGNISNPSETYANNQGLCSFFNESNSKFYTIRYEICEIQSFIRLYVGDVKEPEFNFIGSGSNNLTQIFKSEFFIKKWKEINNIDDFEVKKTKLINLFNYLYKEISEINDSVSKEYSLFISTKENPDFKNINN
jgi:hypothetical protein